MTHTFRWHRVGRFDEPCRLICAGTLNSVMVEFGDGFRMITSRRALKRIRHDG